MELVWSVPASSKENDRIWTNRGETYRSRRGGGGGQGPKPFMVRAEGRLFFQGEAVANNCGKQKKISAAPTAERIREIL